MKIKRIALFLITIVCITMAFAITAEAKTTYKTSCLIDNGGYINDADEVVLQNRLREVEESTGVAFRVYVYTCHSSSDYIDIYDYERIVGEKFDDLVLLTVSYEYGTYYYEFFKKGSPDTDITEKEIGRILDNKGVYDNIKSGKLYEGIDEYITLAEKALSGKLRNSFKSVFVPAFIISLAVAVGASVYVFFKYRKKLHAASYPLEKYANLNLSIADDHFVTKTVTSVRVSTPSSSGGGRSSGGSRNRR